MHLRGCKNLIETINEYIRMWILVVVVRLWLYEYCVMFFQGLEIIFRVGIAILQYNQTDLIQLDMEGMSQVRRKSSLSWTLILYTWNNTNNSSILTDVCLIFSPQHFQKVIPHQFDSCPDKLILRAYQVKYNPKRMKKWVIGLSLYDIK